MKLKILLPLAIVAAVAVVAAQTTQEVKILTSDTQVMAGGRGGGGAGLAGGPPMAVGTGVVFGKIVEADSDRPVPGSIVTINLPGVQPIRVMADGQGRFGFRDLPKGRFNITATRPGWVDGAYGRTRPAGPSLPITLADGERVSNVTVPLWRFASITGRVVDESGDALVNVPVQVLKRTTVGGKMRLTMVNQDTTDDHGIYRVGSLEPGDYVVVVPIQAGSADMPLDAARAMKEVMAVRSVAMSADVSAPMMLNGFMMGSGASAGLGEDGRPLAFATVFYPNSTTSARATVLTVASAEERSAIDFQLKPVPISRVSGVASGPDGPVPNLQLTLVPAEADEAASSVEVMNGFSDEQGKFTIDGVPPGQYILRAVRTPRVAMGPGLVTNITTQGGQVVSFRATSAGGAAPLPTDPTLWTEMPVSVGTKDLENLAVGLRPGIKMAGVVQFNGGAEHPPADQLSGSISIMLEPADSRPGVLPGRGRVDPNGTFATVGVPPGRYFLRVSGSFPNYSFQSALVGGRDASVVPIDFESGDVSGVTIVFTDRATELSGQVTAEGAPESLTVLVFPAESSAWVGYGNSSRRFATTRVDKDGNYKVQNLPAGQYLAVALPDKMANDWQNPKFLETLVAGATRVQVRDGEKATASLRVAR